MGKGSIKNKTINGLLWSFIDLLSKQGIQLLIQIVLARLLLPEHFGLIGMVTIFIAISNTIVQSGLDQALIREKKPTQEEYSTVFHFNMLVSIIIYILLYFSAPIISRFFNEPQLISIIRIIMITVLINAFGVIQRVLLIRKVDFKTQTKVTVIGGIISGSIAILLATNGFGVWSLVVQSITMQLTQVTLLFFSNRWFPSLTFSYTAFKRYFTFGYRLLLSGLIDTTFKNIQLVIIGRIYPSTALGYYTNATKLRDVSSQSSTQAIQKVTYPVLSRMKDEKDRLFNNYKRIIKMTAFLNFPFMIGLAVVAPIFIPLLLGDQWIPSVLYFQLLSISGMFYPIQSINLNILKVTGRTDLLLSLEVVKKIILVALLAISIFLDSGIIGLIIATIINSFISLLINLYFSGREIGYSLKNQLLDLASPFVLSILMGGIVIYSASYSIGIAIIDLAIQISLGIIVYMLLSLLFKSKEMKELMKITKQYLSRDR